MLPNFDVTERFFDAKIREYIHRYNYTHNPDGIFRAIKYMYTYWPNPKNLTHIREQYIHVITAASSFSLFALTVLLDADLIVEHSLSLSESCRDSPVPTRLVCLFVFWIQDLYIWFLTTLLSVAPVFSYPFLN